MKEADKYIDLANDKNVDLVVCSVRVDRHFMTVKPSLEAGKAVFVEWPMEKNLSIAKEMAALAAKSGSKTIVGIQASFDPVLRMMRKCVDEGKLGKLLSSTIFASQGNGGETEVKNVRYFLDREVGGNLVSIRFGHAIETVTTGKITSLSALETPLLTTIQQCWENSRLGKRYFQTDTQRKISSTRRTEIKSSLKMHLIPSRIK